MKMIPVLLAGGIGSRLWPLSREHYPKQLLALLGQDSLLQATLRRVLACDNVDSFIIICNEEHRFDVLAQVAQLNPEVPFHIMLEPEGRNTAAAAALAANFVEADSQLLFLPADHVLKPLESFIKTVGLASKTAADQHLVTFGIAPSYPETGYGYIHAGKAVSDDVFVIDQFVEKPDLDKAQQFLAAGDYFWNSGMFLFPTNLLLSELKRHSPQIYSAVANACQFVTDGHFVRIDAKAFAKTPDDSIDYALMEHTDKALMVRFNVEWSDIGSWQSLYEFEAKDADGNSIFGDVVNVGSKNCLLRSEAGLLAAVGLDNIIAVATEDCVLIAAKDKTQDVKHVVKQLRAEQREEAVRHIVQHHKWGRSTLLNAGRQLKIKRVDIEPGATMSYHQHQHKAETWLVVSGTVTVEFADGSQRFSDNQSFYIPVNTPHRLSNETEQLVSLVEVQSGSELDDEDIIRHD